jgi:poly(hydroxyalkanoate) granule-associated protein
MLKKAREARDAAPEAGAADSSKSVLESSRQIWLAGLGAFSRAQAEGMKVFEALVKQGEAVETKTRQAASDTASAARHAAQSTAREVQQMAGGTWDKLEKVFEDRVARALARLGVHTQTDVARLSARVDALAEAVNELIKASGGTPVKKPRPSVGRMVQGAVSTATRTATSAAGAVTNVARNASGVVSTAGKTAKRRRALRDRRLLAVEPLDLLDVALHRLVGAHALELHPRVVLGAADEIEAARAGTRDVPVGRLLVERVELQQRRVVGALLRLLGSGGRRLEPRLQVVLLGRCSHRDSAYRHFGPGGVRRKPATVHATLARTRTRAQ